MSPSNYLKLKLFTMDIPIPEFPEAACAAEGLDPETWFTEDATLAKVAKGYCILCPYGPKGDNSCYDSAIEEETSAGYFAYGIRGGRDAAYRQRRLDYARLQKELGLAD